ncbi:hypothetical protein NY08_2462 [Rhodococcus sp. B7740]|uniref:hypothetical protein n=1 Tax=Rhodococcus sp. B7740 TaxID=1564114 RepID=UPI0005D83016|nr:hypothetical protein [Rhodococcus sp. B7740]AJW40485.1 hypothetical protein NY08_2462 [Rhodococcus sp. B7740]
MNAVMNRMGDLVEVRSARAGDMRFVAVAWEGDYGTQTMQECPDALILADALRFASAALGFDQLIPAMQATLRVSSAALEGVHDVTIEWSDSHCDLVDLSPERAMVLADYIAAAARVR